MFLEPVLSVLLARVAPLERRAQAVPPERRVRLAPVPQALRLVSAAALGALAAYESGSAPAPLPAEGRLAKKRHRLCCLRIATRCCPTAAHD
jgi:hypothetical protein